MKYKIFYEGLDISLFNVKKIGKGDKK